MNSFELQRRQLALARAATQSLAHHSREVLHWATQSLLQQGKRRDLEEAYLMKAGAEVILADRAKQASDGLVMNLLSRGHRN